MTLRNLRKQAERFLAPAAQSPTLAAEDANPFPINNWTSHCFGYEYLPHGQRTWMNVTFLNYSTDQQLVIHATMVPGDASALSARIAAMLNSLYRPGAEVPSAS